MKRKNARVVLASDEGVDVGAKWASICDEHGVLMGSSSRKLATMPTAEFCDECRDRAASVAATVVSVKRTTWRLVDVANDGAELAPLPQLRRDFRGTVWTIVGFAPPAHEGSTGRVIAIHHDDPTWNREFYPSVFDLALVSSTTGVH
jgi:hypothetical protein